MKLTIDEEQKTIQIEREVSLSDLIKKLDELFPNQSWKEYTLLPYNIGEPKSAKYGSDFR